ncbi:MAG TPA: helix-turn-helix domain-containing protein [Pyrinomonadaceae bacterium]|nr:helix-turn-helix domain-containing protein [Pyrinomonadaceae bacterium]
MIDSPREENSEAPVTNHEQNDSDHTSPTQRTAAYHPDSNPVGRSQAGEESDVEEWVPLSVIEGRYVAKVLEHTRGNKQAAARVLGVDRKTLDRMIKRHNIETTALRARTKPSNGAANSMTPDN